MTTVTAIPKLTRGMIGLNVWASGGKDPLEAWGGYYFPCSKGHGNEGRQECGFKAAWDVYSAGIDGASDRFKKGHVDKVVGRKEGKDPGAVSSAATSACRIVCI